MVAASTPDGPDCTSTLVMVTGPPVLRSCMVHTKLLASLEYDGLILFLSCCRHPNKPKQSAKQLKINPVMPNTIEAIGPGSISRCFEWSGAVAALVVNTVAINKT